MARSDTTRQQVKLGLTAALTVASVGMVGFGGLAAWSASTTNAANTITAGTLHMSNTASATTCTDTAGACGLVFNVGAIKPGQTVTGTVAITNSGTATGVYASAVAASGGTGLCAKLIFTAADETAQALTLPVNMANGAITLPASDVNMVAGATHTFTFTAKLPAASTNADQGLTCTFNLVWSAS